MLHDFRVSVIIPNFNGVPLLIKNLPLVIKAKKYEPNRISEIIVVDDGSTDESVLFLKENFKEVKIIKHKINRGFPASVNTGARGAKENLLALLNNDVVPEENFLVSAIKHFSDNRVFAVSLHEKGYGWAKGYFKDGFIIHQPGPETRDVHDTFWVSGGSGVFRRDMWMRLGGMDEKLLSPFYWEDVDICYRAAKRGFKLLWEPAAVVYHEHESTVKKINKRLRSRIQERNQLLLIWKNLTSPGFFRRHLIGLVARISRSPGYVIIFFMALSKLKYVLKSRKKEIKESKVSDEALFAKY